MLEIPIDQIIEEAVKKFSANEAVKHGLQINQVTLAIKFKTDGTPYYATLFDGKWIEGKTRYFELSEIIEALN